MVLVKTLENPLDFKEIQPVYPKGDRSWVFMGGTDVEAETPILWPPDAGKDWGQEKKGMREDEMVGWHHWYNGRGFGGGLWELVIDREAWCATVHSVAKSRTRLSKWTELNYPRRGACVVPSMGSQRVAHDIVTEYQHNCSQISAV